MMNSGPNKKELNFELNVIPMIDILSVCICFLLMTVVWIQVGALKASQSLGGQPQTQERPAPAVWATVQGSDRLQLEIKNAPKMKHVFQNFKLSDGKSISQFLSAAKTSLPELKTALIVPSKNVNYDSIVSIMDQMKKEGLKDIGISPL